MDVSWIKIDLSRQAVELCTNAFDALAECATRQASDFMTCGDQDSPDRKQRVEKARCRRRSDENFHAILEVYFQRPPIDSDDHVHPAVIGS